MSDPFLDDDSSPEHGQRREFYEIVQSDAIIYRIASGDRDIVYAGNTYTASPAARTDVSVSTATGEFQMSLSLPLKHPLAQRYFAMGSPPRQMIVTVYQKQLNSGAVERVWYGEITSMAVEQHVAKFLIPSRMSRTLSRPIPTVTVGRLCPHILYDAQCRIDPAGFSVVTTVARFNGRSITLITDPAFFDEDFALGGDIRHSFTGEIQTVFSENGPEFDGTTTFEMQAPIPEVAVGDSVVVRAGCRHDIPTCHDKFDNLVNYGGFPELPFNNLFTPGAFGVRAQ